MTTDTSAAETRRDEQPVYIKVWDQLVRIFHWALVIAFAVALLSSEEAEEAEEVYWRAPGSSEGVGLSIGGTNIHEFAGYVVLGLIGFRIIWGIIGTKHARFTDFIYRPSVVTGYLRDMVLFKTKRYIGHNPAGGAMIVALFVALLATGATGYLMVADTGRTAYELKELHEVLSNLTLVLIIAHVIGVVVTSLEHRENLTRAMIHGRKRSASPDG